MRAILWLLGLFVVAVVAALFAGDNHDTVTLFWEPYRIDVSLNLALVALAGLFVVLHMAFNAVSALLRIPQEARRWRMSQRERGMYSALLDALTLLVSGRFLRARKAAERVLEMDEALVRGGEKLPFAARLRAMAHLVAAESAHAVQDRGARETHWGRALLASQTREAQEMLDGVRLRAARWAFDDRQAGQALEQLNQLPLGTSRRTLALRIRFKAARLAGDARLALDTARLLTKHRAFSEMAGASIARGLAIEALRGTHDAVQVQKIWNGLDASEQQMPDVALFAARRLSECGGSAAQAQAWLMPVWKAATEVGPRLSEVQRIQLVATLETLFSQEDAALDTQWLRRIEQAQSAHPADPLWNYLAGVACMHMQLWGKAQQLLRQSVGGIKEVEMRRRAWQRLGAMADDRQDTEAALAAYREAARS